MTYIPVTKVLTDGEGNFLGVLVCECDTGDPTWPGHSEECPLS